MTTETVYRVALEDIVLELQSRVNKAKDQFDAVKGSLGATDPRTHFYEQVYLALNSAYEYIRVKYDGTREVKHQIGDPKSYQHGG